MSIRIGFDLDNTILNYDKAFRELAKNDVRLKNVQNLDKETIKSYLISNYGGQAWTKVQGILYTEYLDFAEVDALAVDLINEISSKHRVEIVSHKSRFPIIGPKIDMRNVAVRRLKKTGITFSNKNDISVNFFNTSQEKINYINSLDFSFFLDDLLEILLQLNVSVTKGWFVSSMSSDKRDSVTIFSNWQEVAEFLSKIDDLKRG
jgi:hypothetical protein